MALVPGKVEDRLIAGIKRFQPILSDAKKRDVGEADTVTIIIAMLSEIFGYDKFSEITAEHEIKGTFCDLAIKIDGKVGMLIEVKAIGLELKDGHLNQAVGYAAKEGVEWVALTNGVCWRIYRMVFFSKPITQDKIVDINFLELKPKDDFKTLFLWSKEGWTRTALEEYEAQQQASSPFLIAATVLSEPVLKVIRLQLKRVAKLNKDSPDIKIETEQIEEVLRRSVIKLEVLDGEKAIAADKKIEKAAKVSHETDDKDEPEKPSADTASSNATIVTVTPAVSGNESGAVTAS